MLSVFYHQSHNFSMEWWRAGDCLCVSLVMISLLVVKLNQISQGLLFHIYIVQPYLPSRYHIVRYFIAKFGAKKLKSLCLKSYNYTNSNGVEINISLSCNYMKWTEWLNCRIHSWSEPNNFLSQFDQRPIDIFLHWLLEETFDIYRAFLFSNFKNYQYY